MPKGYSKAIRNSIKHNVTATRASKVKVTQATPASLSLAYQELNPDQGIDNEGFSYQMTLGNIANLNKAVTASHCKSQICTDKIIVRIKQFISVFDFIKCNICDGPLLSLCQANKVYDPNELIEEEQGEEDRMQVEVVPPTQESSLLKRIKILFLIIKLWHGVEDALQQLMDEVKKVEIKIIEFEDACLASVYVGRAILLDIKSHNFPFFLTAQTLENGLSDISAQNILTIGLSEFDPDVGFDVNIKEAIEKVRSMPRNENSSDCKQTKKLLDSHTKGQLTPKEQDALITFTQKYQQLFTTALCNCNNILKHLVNLEMRIELFAPHFKTQLKAPRYIHKVKL
jgi:hypothetical protein